MTTPTPEAIEAAEAAVRKYYSAGGWVRTADVAKLAVEAAYPLMAAEVLRDTAKDFAEGEWVDALIEAENDVETVVAVDEWLNHRAATIESEATK